MITAVKSEQKPEFFFIQITGYHIVLNGFPDALGLLFAGGQFLCSACFHFRQLPGNKGIHARGLILHQKQAQICLAALRVHVQNPVIIPLGLSPLAVRQCHLAALEQGVYIGPAAALLYDNGLLDRLMLDFFGPVCGEHLADAADKVLNKADFAHVIAHQHRKLLRQVVWVHVPVAGNEQLSLVLAHHGKKTAPLVLDPDGVEVFSAGANSHHDLGRVERGEYVRLILCAGYIFQRNAGEEHAPALFGELIVDVLRQYAVAGALPVCVQLLVADENIIRLGVLRGGEDAALYLGNLCRVLLILAAGNAVGMFKRSEVVHVFKEAVKACPVAGGQPFIAHRVFHIFNTVPAEGAAPVRLRIRVILGDNALVHRKSLVKLSHAAKMIASVECCRALFITDLGQGHRTAAVFTDSKCFFRRKLHIPAAHFAFDYSHVVFPLYLVFISVLFILYFQMLQCKFHAHHHDFVSGTPCFYRHGINVAQHILWHTHGNDRRVACIFLSCNSKNRLRHFNHL